MSKLKLWYRVNAGILPNEPDEDFKTWAAAPGGTFDQMFGLLPNLKGVGLKFEDGSEIMMFKQGESDG